ncbi:MAG: hypothetical protein HQ477_06420 [Chloroflexi bacterium]|nr:hypothetical protein [Chloroflexota bacterium]
MSSAQRSSLQNETICTAGALPTRLCDNTGFDALLSAAFGGHIHTVRRLVDAGSDIAHTSQDGHTAETIDASQGLTS